MAKNLLPPTGFIKYFSTKQASIICLLIAILCKAALLFSFYSIQGSLLMGDMLSQALAAKNLVEGHGLMLTHVHADDLSKLVYDPLPEWPPAYSLVVSVFYMLLNNNLDAACFAVSVCSFAAFLLLLYRLLLFLQLPVYLINILILLNGLSITDYVQRFSPTDASAMFFCMWSCYLTAVFIIKKERSPYFGFFHGFINACAGLFRYMYVGFFPVLPLLLICNGWYKKDKRILRGGLYSLAISILLTVGMLVFQYLYTGSALYAKPSEKGFFFENLLHIHPFAISSLINLNFYIIQLQLHTGILYDSWMKIATAGGVVSLLILLYVFTRYGLKKALTGKTAREIFFAAGGIVSCFILVILCTISVRNSSYFNEIPESRWTFVSENRYFAVAGIVVQLFLACCLFGYTTNGRRGKTMWVLRFMFLLICSIEILHGGYFILKFYKGQGPVPQIGETKILNRVLKENREKRIYTVFTSTGNIFFDKAAYLGAGVLKKPDALNGPGIKSSKPVFMLICLRFDTIKYFSYFLRRYGVNYIGNENGYLFFTYYIKPVANSYK